MTTGAAPAETGRPARRFPALLRARPTSLALLSVGLVAGAIIGVQLGQSTISQINPIHFQGPLERPQAITPPPEPAPYDPYAQHYVWTMPSDPTLADAACGPDCGAQTHQALGLAMDESAGRDPALPAWRDATPATELRPWAPGAVPDRSRTFERYMHYPVNQEQAENPLPEPARTVAASPAEALRPPPPVPAPAAGE